MARSRPLTWKNVGSPRFDNSALNVASNAFTRAGQGFDTFSDAMRERTETEDQRLTNEAITDMLNGGPQTSNNRRVDATALFDVSADKQALDSDLLNDQFTRNKMGVETDLKKLELENAPELHRLTLAQLREETLADKASRLRDEYGLKTERYTHEQLVQLETGKDALNDYERQITDEQTNRWLGENVAPGTEPTEQQWSQARIAGRSFMESPDGRAIIEQFAIKNKIDGDAWQISNAGGRDQRVATIEDSLRTSAADRAAQRLEDSDLEQDHREAGKFDRTIWKNGRMQPASDADIKREKMATLDDALSALQNGTDGVTGVNIGGLITPTKSNKADRKLLDFARKKIPNASMYVSALQTYFDPDGSLDRKALNKALNKIGQQAIMEQINLDREAKGEAPIGLGPEASPGGGGGNKQVIDRLAAGLVSPQNAAQGLDGDAAIQAVQQNAEKFKVTLDSAVQKIDELAKDPRYGSKAAQGRLREFKEIFTTGKAAPPTRPGQISFLGAYGEKQYDFEGMQEKYEQFLKFEERLKTISSKQQKDVNKKASNAAIQQLLATGN